MDRTFPTLVVCLSLVLGGCISEQVESVDLDLDHDGDADPIPKGRGGVWYAEDAAAEVFEGVAGDICDFDNTFGRTIDSPFRSVTCIDHRLVATEQTRLETCEPVHVDGRCVTLPSVNCAEPDSVERYSIIACADYVGSIPDDGYPTVPWTLVDEGSCATLHDELAENGDGCTGDFVCRMGWTLNEDGAHWPVVAWCDAGELRMVAPWDGLATFDFPLY